MQTGFARIAAILVLAVLASFVVSTTAFAQSRPQRPDNPRGEGKRNERPTPKSPEQLRKEAEEKARLEEERDAELIVDDPIKVDTNIVSLDAVVINKKTGQIITGLTKENFSIYEEGVKKEISAFASPEAPITVTLVVEYSKWTETFGRAAGGVWEPGAYEAIRPAAMFLSGFIKPPNDYASVIAFDMRPTPITDFTNDPERLRQSVNILLRNRPAFRENNLFDALKFALVGGRADSVVLENSEEDKSEYGGMVDVRSPRKAIILISSGIDTFSRINLSDVRREIQEAGVPIYIISTGNLFYKMYEQYLDPKYTMPGMPDRMDFLQAKNQMNTFAKESGGMHFEMTFQSEIPAYLQSINGLLRSQYNLSYDLLEKHQPGKRYKIQIKVDVDGDGITDEKRFTVQHRPFVYTAEPDKKDKKKK